MTSTTTNERRPCLSPTTEDECEPPAERSKPGAVSLQHAAAITTVGYICVCFINDSIRWRSLPAGITTPCAQALPPSAVMKQSCGGWRLQSLHGRWQIWTWRSYQRLKLSERDTERERREGGERGERDALCTCSVNLLLQFNTRSLTNRPRNQSKNVTESVVFQVSRLCSGSTRGHQTCTQRWTVTLFILER